MCILSGKIHAPLGKSNCHIHALLVCLTLVGCVGSPHRFHGEYGCVTRGSCNLPEQVRNGNSLIYVIRPYRLLNQGERHYLYVKKRYDLEETLYARVFGSTYCAIHAEPGDVDLRIEGYLNDDKLSLSTVVGKIYYVEVETTTSIFTTKLKVRLKQVEEKIGEEYLMNEVTSSCAERKNGDRFI